MMNVSVATWLPWTAVVIYLICCTYTDIRRQYINTSICIAFAAVGLCFIVFLGDGDILYYAAGIIPGLLLIIISKFSRGAIGMGDGIMFVVAGMYIGFNEAVSLFYISVFLCAIVSGVLLMAHRRSGKDQLPFAPFALCAAVCILIYRIITHSIM